MKVNMQDIKKLREATGAGVLDVKKSLEAAKGDVKKAKEALMKKGAAKAAKKQAERTVKDGLVHAYVHGGGRVGSMVLVACETDFVAKTEDFEKLCHDIAMQVCSSDYKNIKELLADDYLKDPSKKVSEVITAAVARLGEKIEVINFSKLSVSDV